MFLVRVTSCILIVWCLVFLWRAWVGRPKPADSVGVSCLGLHVWQCPYLASCSRCLAGGAKDPDLDNACCLVLLLGTYLPTCWVCLCSVSRFAAYVGLFMLFMQFARSTLAVANPGSRLRP